MKKLKSALICIVVSLVFTSLSFAGDRNMIKRVKALSGTTLPFDTSAGVTSNPTVSSGAVCVIIQPVHDSIYYTVDDSTPVDSTTAGHGFKLDDGSTVILLPKEADDFKFTGDGNSAGYVVWQPYDGWISPY